MKKFFIKNNLTAFVYSIINGVMLIIPYVYSATFLQVILIKQNEISVLKGALSYTITDSEKSLSDEYIMTFFVNSN